MTDLQPKGFQTDALEALRGYLSDARLRMDPAVAFLRATNGLYRPLPGMPQVPTICLRLPTGGGKTMLAAMCIGVAADTYLQRDLPLVLWLVPSDAIRRQTLRALTDTDHPYRRALAMRFGTAVQVLEMSGFAMLTQQDVLTRCTVLVGTMQSLQVNNTEGRRVYAHNENLEGFFATSAVRDVEGSERFADGRPKFSFANLLKVQRPMVILDEAHRFVTPLAQEVRQRIGAGVVVELTATPDRDANVLYSAAASQLKADGMIKLPVLLTEHRSNWQQAVTAAVRERCRLAEVAKSEPRYIRPILLIQAQNADETATWQVIKQHLLETEELQTEEIAVVTGTVDELGDTDLLSPACAITTILTVQALAEGWDCSFAYVLCSVANLSSSRAVEQMIGRVLRMPGAKACVSGELNQAYVHASSREFGDTAKALRDGLVKSGFDEAEARSAVRPAARLPLLEDAKEFRLTVPVAPDVSHLPPDEAAAIRVEQNAYGSTELFIRGAIPLPVRREVLQSLPEPSRATVARQMDEHDRAYQPTPAERGERFAVPQLAVEIGGEWLPFDGDTLEEHAAADLLQHPFDVVMFSFDETTRTYSFDLFGELLQVSWLRSREAQPLLLQRDVTQVGLVRWLVNRLRDSRVTDGMLCAWVDDALTRLQKRPSVTLPVLDQGRYILERLLTTARDQAWANERQQAYTKLLFATEAHPATTSEFGFRFPAAEYPATSFCERTVFTKHFYDRPGELKERGEEYDCAVAIDRWQHTEVWVRNLARRERTSFWLQTSSDLFYPDFVVKLCDGRVLAVEYKGKYLETSNESEEKLRLGQLWADRSSGTALFAMITVKPGAKSIQQQLDDALLGGKSIHSRR